MLHERAQRVLLNAPRAGSTVALAVDQLVAWGVLYYAYAVLSAPIADDLGIPRSFVAAACSAGLLVAAVLAGPVGTWLDRSGSRTVMRSGAVLGIVAMVALAFVRDLTSLVVAFVLLGAAQALALYEPAFRTIVDWFPHEPRRSRGLLLLTSVAGFASTVFLPLATFSILRHGWRPTVLLLALGLLVIVVPLRWALPLSMRPHRPRPVEPAARARPGAMWLAVAFAVQAFVATGVALTLVWHLVEQGDAPAYAASIAGLAGAAQVPGRLLYSPLRRLCDGGRRMPVLLGTQALALVAVIVGSGAVTIAGVVLFGAASGMMTLERATVLVDWYGHERFGAHNGRIVAAATVARALAPFAVEALRGCTSYGTVFGGLALLLVLGAACAHAAAHVYRARCERQETSTRSTLSSS
jgi:MFS family permease